MEHSSNASNLAIFFQASPAPPVDGIIKPFKSGGYSDSGADIAFALQKAGVEVVTPVIPPRSDCALDWVFPDNLAGIHEAYHRGARTFWMNTVLFANHPFASLNLKDIVLVGQRPDQVQRFDDKFTTNEILRRAGLPVAESIRVTAASSPQQQFPCILKPIRGRGSQGVTWIHSKSELLDLIKKWTLENEYGSVFLCEEVLPGTEITIAVMPPGSYQVQGTGVEKNTAWALPPVLRFNHIEGIAPYNGVVAIVKNSRVLTPEEFKQPALQAIMKSCEQAAERVAIKAPIRIDCREDSQGQFKIFDLNMKPNLTGKGRPGRDDQDSLLALAAEGMGWSYADLLLNILNQSWKP